MFTSGVGGRDRPPREEPPIIHPADRPHDEPDTSPTSLYRPEEPPCPCGARPEDGELCRKCTARAAWVRRHANRGHATPDDPAYDPKPFRTRRSGPRRPGPSRPQGRDTDRRRPQR